jgi:tRNA nucleotidyltransferase/poly(A) polymerase
VSLEPVAPFRPFNWPALVRRIAGKASDPARLYLVGGIVRDALRGLSSHDLDLATPDNGLIVARRLADALGGAYYPVDPARHTGRIILNEADRQVTIDVASFRGDDLLADLQGRDFTVNAMAVCLSDLVRLIDPLGGQGDLLVSKQLRQCSPTSIADDPIRALRAVRQSLQFGLRMEPATREAARSAAPLLLDEGGNLCQPERARDELFKMLSSSRPASMLRLLNALGLLAPLCPFSLPTADVLAERLAVVEQLTNLITIISPLRDDDTAADLMLGVAVMVLDRYRRPLQEYLSRSFADGRSLPSLLLLSALSPVAGPSARGWEERLRLSREEGRILALLEQTRCADLIHHPPQDDRAIFRYFRKVGETGIGGLLLVLAEYLAKQRTFATAPEEWGHLLELVAAPLLEAFFRRHQQVVAPPPLLTGNDLVNELGLEPGPIIGQLIEQLLEEQAAGTIHTKTQALQLAKRLRDELNPDPA